MTPERLSDRDELRAIAAWRSLLLERHAGTERTPADLAARFPELEADRAAERARGDEPTDDDLAGGARVGAFDLVRPIGRGAQAEVWLAHDQAGTDVALKIFTLSGPGALGMAMRLRREVATVARIDAPGVCQVFDTGTDGTRAWIAMRYVAGQTLAQVLAAEPGAPSPAARTRRLAWIEAVARTVHAVHAAGFVHRDLKPGNIALEHGATPVVLDFGVAKALAADDQLTATGASVGTPAYMAPEQIADATVGPQSDVFALGAILFECVVGQRPFLGATPFELQRDIVERPHGFTMHDWRRSLGRELATVLDTAMAKEPSHRYRTAQEFADDLARIQRGEPAHARAAGPVRLALRFARRRPGITALVSLLLVTILTALAVALSLLAARNRELARADREHEFVLHLSDRSRLRQLQRELDDELAIDSAHLPRFVDWWGRATELLDRFPLHETFLASLRAAGTPWPETDRRALAVRLRQREQLDNARTRERQYRGLAEAAAARGEQPANGIDYALQTATSLLQRAEADLASPAGMDFPSDSDRFMHGEVAALVAELRQFALLRPGSFTRKAGHWLWQKAQKVRPDSLDAHAEGWRRAIARIAAPGGRYHGLRIEPQEGLVPLGPDPASGLEEFAHVATGSIPVRDPLRGSLAAAPDAAMVLVLLPGGIADIGLLEPPPPDGAPAGGGLPQPVAVELAPFFCGKHEVTRSQWYEIMYGNPAATSRTIDLPTRLPVETVANTIAALFARRLCMALPTEAQWEYACRAGTRTAYWFGPSVAAAPGPLNVQAENTASTTDAPTAARAPRAVGLDPANPFGLHDMHGNVAEWTRESYSSYTLPFLPGDGARMPSAVYGVVVRGGSYRDPAYAAQSWWRSMQPPFHELATVGVRLVRPVR